MGELARLFGQLTPVKFPSLSPVACSKSILMVPVCVRYRLKVIVLDAFALIIQQLKHNCDYFWHFCSAFLF